MSYNRDSVFPEPARQPDLLTKIAAEEIIRRLTQTWDVGGSVGDWLFASIRGLEAELATLKQQLERIRHDRNLCSQAQASSERQQNTAIEALNILWTIHLAHHKLGRPCKICKREEVQKMLDELAERVDKLPTA